MTNRLETRRPSLEPALSRAARDLAALRRPSVEHFNQRLLVWLRRTDGITQEQEAAALARVTRGTRLPLALRELGIDSRALVRAILNAKGAFSVEAASYVGELWIHSHIPKLQAYEAGLLPAAVVGRTLYAYVDSTTKVAFPPTLMVDGTMLDVVVIGSSERFAHDIETLYGALAMVEPGTLSASLPNYLVQRGVLAATARDAHSSHTYDVRQWAELCIRLGANEVELYAACAAYFDTPFIGKHVLAELADPQVEPAPDPNGRLEVQGLCVLRRVGDELICAIHHAPEDATVAGLLKSSGATSLNMVVTTPTAFRDHLQQIHDSLASVGETIGDAAIEISLESMNLQHFPDLPLRFNRLLLEAIQSRASDIHVEYHRHKVGVRFRIDGAFVRVDTPWLTQNNALALVTKVKVDSKLDISERRRPQDGVLRRRVGERTVDFRVAIQPTLWGENVVLRVLDQSKGAPLLSELGLGVDTLTTFRRLLDNPLGLILLTGPTGSGKTTTLYAALEELRQNDVKIVTAEDPVEYAMDGVQQSQVNELIGNTFDRFLRAFLRQDPDVILVGEIRDPPTAEMTLRAALTGHLVFSTLHVNDALGAIRRLNDLGVSLNILSDSLLCVLSQRLVRRICAACAQPRVPPAELLRECFSSGAPAGATFLFGRGCEKCRSTGYKGRVALVELWAPTPPERELILQGAPTATLREQAMRGGLRSLLQDAREKMVLGITTLEEVRSVMSFDELHRSPSFPIVHG